MVSSFIPSAALPDSDMPSAHPSPLEKSSLNIMLPISSFNTSVGVTTGAEKGVGVAVGGNHITVSVGVAVGVNTGVLVGEGSGISVGRQAPNVNESDPKTRIMTRASNTACQDLSDL
jgi:hypothetical protein